MSLNLGFDLSLGLQQKLSFQMIQSLKLLQSNTLQLEQQIQHELAMNPLLEPIDEIQTVAQEEYSGTNDEDDEFHVEENEIDYQQSLTDGFAGNAEYYNDKTQTQEQYDYVESLQVYDETLEEILHKQIEDFSLSEQDKLLMEYFASSLDENGYLTISIAEMSLQLEVDTRDLEILLWQFQKCDPAGIGARDLRECLMLQIERNGSVNSIAYQILEENWKLFSRLKIPAIARRLKVDIAVIQKAIDTIRLLDPKPGQQYAQTVNELIIPDLIVSEENGKLIVSINDRFLTGIQINPAYSEMLKRKSIASKETKQFIRDRFNSAQWLIRAIEQRHGTMLRVMDAILARQNIFFKKGPPNLAPLKLQDIANDVEMHVSTISRVTNNKYVQTPYGLYELKYFFSEAIQQNDDGEDISTREIKDRLRQLLSEEDSHEPLSDQHLSEIMVKAGFPLARRTVAKYRTQMGIPSARMRKKYD